MSRRTWIALALAAGSSDYVAAQQPEFSTVPTQAVYEFQLNYQLPWQRWYGGPGLSLGGTMPTQGAFGYSSLNGLPLPAPLGAGVYVNTPAPHGAMMPGAPPLGMGLGMAAGPMMMPPGGPVPMGRVGPAGPIGPAGAMGPVGPGQFQPTGFTPPPQGLAAGANPPPTQTFGLPRMRQQPVPVSPPASRRASLEQQKLGDDKLRQQQWTQAYVHYRNAADLAPERAEANFRLGLAYTAMKQYSSAIRSFKRSIDLDPTLPQSGETLPMILGADEKAMKERVIPTVADWAREDLRDIDRLFVLGLMLYFDEDPRGSEIFESALRTGGSNEYIQAFVNPNVGNQTARRADLRARPNPNLPATDSESLDGAALPPPPAPMPSSTEPFPEPPPT